MHTNGSNHARDSDWGLPNEGVVEFITSAVETSELGGWNVVLSVMCLNMYRARLERCNQVAAIVGSDGRDKWGSMYQQVNINRTPSVEQKRLEGNRE